MWRGLSCDGLYETAYRLWRRSNLVSIIVPCNINLWVPAHVAAQEIVGLSQIMTCYTKDWVMQRGDDAKTLYSKINQIKGSDVDPRVAWCFACAQERFSLGQVSGFGTG
jgi:hypothetical protein